MKEASLLSVEEILRVFVECDTRNPPGNELCLARSALALLDGFDVETELFDLGENRGNLVTKIKAQYPQRAPLVLNGHMDTVVTSCNWKRDPLTLTKVGNRLYGRGTTDMKGALSAQLRVAMGCSLRPERMRQDLWLVWTAGEEVDCIGAKAISHEIGNTDFTAVVIGEPSENRLVSAQKGALWTRLTVAGKSAHGAYPELGTNAIDKCMAVVSRIRHSLQRIPGHDLLGAPTLNWGTIVAGSQPNIVPDLAEANLDIRFGPPTEAQDIVDILETAIQEERCEATVKFETINSRSAFETDRDSAFVKEALEALEQTVPVGMRAYTDGSVLSRHVSCPVIILGPGSIAQAHTTDEYIQVGALTEAVAVYKRLVCTAV